MTQTNDMRTGLRRLPAGPPVVATLDGKPRRVVEFAYVGDHEMPEGEHRIMPIPVND